MDLKLLNEQGQAAATFSAPDTILVVTSTKR